MIGWAEGERAKQLLSDCTAQLVLGSLSPVYRQSDTLQMLTGSLAKVCK